MNLRITVLTITAVLLGFACDARCDLRYVVIPAAEDGSPPLDPDDDIIMFAGEIKNADTLPVTTDPGLPEYHDGGIGTYWDGLSYQRSEFFGGFYMVPFRGIITSSTSNGKPLLTTVYLHPYFSAVPADRTKDIEAHFEYHNDPGFSLEDGVTYYKYRLQLDEIPGNSPLREFGKEGAVV